MMVTKLHLIRWCIAMGMVTMPTNGTASSDTNIIIDLSKDLPEDAVAMDSSPGAAALYGVASSDPLIRAAVVLERGKVVAKYLREDVDETSPMPTHSVTKSWMSLLVGLMAENNLLAINETLGDIFDNDSAWSGVSDETMAIRKAVTVEEMLTMTSGLVLPPIYALAPSSMSVLTDPNNLWGGSSLSNSLAYPDIGPKGEFSYLPVCNIFSYVVKERTGMSPRDYLAKNVLTHLGIIESAYNWEQNLESMEYSFHGLDLTPSQMAKFGQLYLQGGRTGPANDQQQVIAQSWVESSLTTHSMDLIRKAEYGYLFWKFAPNVYCAVGMAGQDICIDQNTERVVVQQRDIDWFNMEEGNYIVTAVAVDPSLSFDAVMPVVAQNGNESAAALFPLTEDAKSNNPSADIENANIGNSSAELSADSNDSTILRLAGFASWLLGLSMLSLDM